MNWVIRKRGLSNSEGTNKKIYRCSVPTDLLNKVRYVAASILDLWGTMYVANATIENGYVFVNVGGSDDLVHTINFLLIFLIED